MLCLRASLPFISIAFSLSTLRVNRNELLMLNTKKLWIEVAKSYYFVVWKSGKASEAAFTH